MDKVIPRLCGQDKCTGCTACMNICAQGAIEMRENFKGELHPVINESKCIGCGVCEKVCPEINNRIERNGLPVVYSCWLKDADRRAQSTSGGAAYAISSTVIEFGGHVWGAAYTEEMEPVYIEANSIEELQPIQKSKYVQCAPRDCFKKIKKELQDGEMVLFSGTSCHVKGLYSFLGRKYDNLLTMDLVCHGVPGQGVFRKYKEYLEEKYSDKMTYYSFRPKSQKNGLECSHCTTVSFHKKGLVGIPKFEDSYSLGFLHNVFLRTCCHGCTSKGIQRFSDYTVADYWGLGKEQEYKEWEQRERGISMLAINSDKGRFLFEEIKRLLVYEERSITEASKGNSAYQESCRQSFNSKSFWKDWGKMSWNEISKKYLCPTKKEIIMWSIKRVVPANIMIRIKSLIGWIK